MTFLFLVNDPGMRNADSTKIFYDRGGFMLRQYEGFKYFYVRGKNSVEGSVLYFLLRCLVS